MKLKDTNRKLGPQICFDRPEKSPCLNGLSKANGYNKAIAIIQKGQDRLKETPRCDMPGFIPSQIHQKMLEKYEMRAKEAEESRLEILHSMGKE